MYLVMQKNKALPCQVLFLFFLDPEKKGIGPDTVGPCSFASQGTRENPFYGYEGATAYAIPGSTVKIGEIICKKSKTNRVSRINAPPEEDEIGLAFGYHE